MTVKTLSRISLLCQLGTIKVRQLGLPSERARRWPSEHARQWTSKRARWRHSALLPRSWELHPPEVLMLPDYLLWLLLSYRERLLLLWPILLRLLQTSRW